MCVCTLWFRLVFRGRGWCLRSDGMSVSMLHSVASAGHLIKEIRFRYVTTGAPKSKFSLEAPATGALY